MDGSSTKLALLIGQRELLRRLGRQLELLDDPPITLGWVITAPADVQSGIGAGAPADAAPTAADDDRDPVLGYLDELEAIVARRTPAVALVCLPAAMSELITSIRTRLRRLGVPDRFMPTLEDQVAGVGPRTNLDLDYSVLVDRPARVIDEHAVGNVVGSKRVLITGAGGSIGSELARIVAARGPAHLALMDRSENALFEIDRQIARREPALPRAALLHDVVDRDGTLAHCGRLKPQLILHAAAHKHVSMMEDHPGSAVDNNLFGTRSVADAADQVGCERFVMISTDKAVNPTSIMGATKRLAELYVQDLGRRSSTACSIVRFGNVLGSSGSALQIWSRQISDGGPLTVTDPRMTRYFMTIPEAAALVIESAALVDPSAADGEVFLLDMGKPIRILDLAERFIRMHGLEPVHPESCDRSANPVPPRSTLPTGFMPIVFTGARPGEKLHEELVFDAEWMRPTSHRDVNVWVLQTPEPEVVEKILRRLAPGSRGHEPAEIARTIRRLLAEISAPVAV